MTEGLAILNHTNSPWYTRRHDQVWVSIPTVYFFLNKLIEGRFHELKVRPLRSYSSVLQRLAGRMHDTCRPQGNLSAKHRPIQPTHGLKRSRRRMEKVPRCLQNLDELQVPLFEDRHQESETQQDTQRNQNRQPRRSLTKFWGRCNPDIQKSLYDSPFFTYCRNKLIN